MQQQSGGVMRNLRALLPITALLVGGLTAGLSVGQADKAPDAEAKLREFMRGKLSASTEILEGFCVDDMQLVIKGAKQFQAMSEAETWRVSNDVMYKQFSNEFRQIATDLIKAAEDKNPDRAMLKWVDATVSCLDCHRFVRGMRVAK
jgi:hypothetical protein